MSEAVGKGRAMLLLGMVILLWGVNWPIMKVGLQSITPLWFAVARVFLGAVSLFVLLAAAGQVRMPPRADLPIVLSVGVLQIGMFLGLTHTALLFVDAGRSAILAYTTPLWVVPIAAVVLHERVGLARLAALGLGMGGLAVLFNPLAVDYHNHLELFGNGMLLLGALVWAITIVHVRIHRWQASPLALMPWQMLIGGALLLPLAFAVDGRPHVKLSPEFVAILAYNGPVASAFCYWAFVTVNRSFGAATTSLGSLGVPVVGVLAATLMLGEPLTAAKLTGLALISGGVAVLSLGHRNGAASC